MFGVSFGDYVLYWIGLAVIGVGSLVVTLVQRARGRGRDGKADE